MITKGTRIKKAKSPFVWIRVLSWMVFSSSSPFAIRRFAGLGLPELTEIDQGVLAKQHPPMARRLVNCGEGRTDSSCGAGV
jgi:hypothetical protein